MIAVKLNGGSLNNVGVLPQAGIACVSSGGWRPCGLHAARRHMYWRSGCQQRSLRLGLQIAISALHVAFGQTFAGRPREAHYFCGSQHSARGYSRRLSQREQLFGRDVPSSSTPGSLFAVCELEVSLLDERLDSPPWLKSRIALFAAADAFVLTRSPRNNSRVRRPMHGCNLSHPVKVRDKFVCRYDRLLSLAL